VSVDRHDGAFTVRLDSGEELRAQAVVVATGFMHFTYVPDELRAAAPDGISAAGPVSHSSQHVDLARFSGREVLIVGAGQSALEGAALLHEAGADVKVVVRGRAARFGTPPTSPPHWQPWSPLGRSWSLYAFSRHGERFRYLPVATRMYLVRNVLGPSGGWWLRYRVDGQVPILTGRRVVRGRVEDGRPVLTLTGSDGGTTEVSADHVMAATGYRVDVDALDFLAPALRASLARTARAPRLDTGFQSSVPGLYFTGFAAAATFGPVMRFVCGTVTAAPRLATRVAAAHP
jgi:cation diffusion facilitator CzcD-associated flavoprotein CzcO